MNNHYPRTVQECLDPDAKYKPAVLRAVKTFKKSKPWRGTVTEREEKFRTLNNAIAAAYDVAAPTLIFRTDETGDSGSSCYIPATNTIILVNYSVVSFLHEISHRLHGRSEHKAVSWSLNLFRRIFPKSWARLEFDGHMVRANRRQS